MTRLKKKFDPIREKDIERVLVREVKKRGGVAEKFTSPGRRSVPDRLCLFPGGYAAFVECKAPGKQPTKLQMEDHIRREEMGFDVFIVDSKDDAVEVAVTMALRALSVLARR